MTKEVEALLAQLEAAVPDTPPRPGNTLDAIMFQAGQRSIVELARHLAEKEN